MSFAEVLSRYWGCTGTTRTFSWKYTDVGLHGTGNVPEMYWRGTDNVLATCWKHTGNILEMHWKSTGKVLKQ